MKDTQTHISKNLPLISIVINDVDKYLDTTIASLNQQNVNVEIFVVDENESPLDYGQDNIKNVRSSVEAVKSCDNDYIYFMDSGDYLSDNCMENILENASKNDSEIIFFNSYEYNGENVGKKNLSGDMINEIDNLEELTTFNGEEIIDSLFNNPYVVYNKVYSRRFLLSDLEEFFKYDSNYLSLNLKSLLVAKRISYESDAANYHRSSNIHQDSLIIDDLIFDVNHSSQQLIEQLNNLDEFTKSHCSSRDVYNRFKVDILVKNLEASRFIDSYVHIPESERKNPYTGDKHLNYSKYYGSNSEYVGLSYDFTEKVFEKTKLYLDTSINDDDLTILTEEYGMKYQVDKIKSILQAKSFEEYQYLSQQNLIHDLTDEKNKLDFDIYHLEQSIEKNKEIIENQKDLLDKSTALLSNNKSNVKELEYESYFLTQKNQELVKDKERLQKMNKDITESHIWKVGNVFRKIKGIFH